MLHRITFQCTLLCCTTLHCSALHLPELLYSVVHCTPCTTLHYSALLFLHYTALQCTVQCTPCTTLHCIALQFLYYTALQYTSPTWRGWSWHSCCCWPWGREGREWVHRADRNTCLAVILKVSQKLLNCQELVSFLNCFLLRLHLPWSYFSPTTIGVSPLLLFIYLYLCNSLQLYTLINIPSSKKHMYSHQLYTQNVLNQFFF